MISVFRTFFRLERHSKLLAEQQGLGDRVVGILYSYCYEKGHNVSLRETVARAAEEAGVQGGAEYVQSDAGTAELEQALRGQRVNGKRVSAAPTFNITVAGMSHDFSGAQDTERWTLMLEQCADIAADARRAE